MSDWYILNPDHTVRLARSQQEWQPINERQLFREHVGDALVSTVFLGLNHAWGDEVPQLFETLVFDGKMDGEMDRCETYDQAVEMHKAMCLRVVEAEDISG